MKRAWFGLVIWGLVAVPSAQAPVDWESPSGVSRPALASCMTGAERAFLRSLAGQSSLSLRAGPERFPLYPLAGNLYGDLFTFNFVDLDPTRRVRDWDCTRITYDGHPGIDVGIRGFGELALGVPVYAARDGIVIGTYDDGPDGTVQTCATGFANHVAVDHGDGRVCFYWHLKQDSVLVQVGQPVLAGEQLGLAGSSGDCTFWPHLHLETHDFGVPIEPYAGDCRPGASEWVEQTPIERALYAWDFNLSDVNPSFYQGPPFDMPRTGTFVQGASRRVSYWALLANHSISVDRRTRILRPDGSLAREVTGLLSGGPYRFSWRSFSHLVDLDVTGTWRVLFDIEGATVVDAPFEVVESPDEIVNRAPYPIAVWLEPAAPRAADVLVCRVQTDRVLDDPDYDIVRYRYVWTADGAVLRDVTTAAQADVLRRLSAPPGSWVECTVTASDGTNAARPTTAGVEIASRVPRGLRVVLPFVGPVPSAGTSGK